MGSGLLALGKVLLSFTLIPTSCHLSGKGCQSGPLNLILQWRALNFRATSQYSRQLCVTFLGHLWCFFPEFGYPTEILTSPQHWDLALDCCLNQNLLYLSPVSLSFSQFLSTSTAKIFPLLILEILSLPGQPSMTLPNYFPLSYDPPSKIQWLFQKEPLCWKIYIPCQAIFPSVFQLSAIHCDPLTTSCELHSNWIKYGLRDQNLFTTFTWGLYQESSFLWQITQGRLWLVDSLGKWTIGLVHGGFRNWYLWLWMSHCDCIRTPVWAILNNAWMTMGWSASLWSHKPSLLWEKKNSSFSRPTTCRDRVPSLPNGNP